MMHALHRLLLPALLLSPVPAAAAAEAPTAVFPVELYDTSGEGMNDALAERLVLVTRELTGLVDAAPAYRTVDMAPKAQAIAAAAPLYGCNGCELDIARDLGATVAFTAQVHKISTLILQIRIVASDVATGKTLAVGDADIRGDNDRAWLHGFRWLARNRLGL